VIQLRPYQEQSVAEIRAAYKEGAKSVLLVSPTGSGKTCLFSYVVSGARALDHRVLILAHRTELIDQISSALKEFSVPHGFIAAGYQNTPAPVQVASVQTLVRRLDNQTAPDLIVQDEAHHLAAGNSWDKIHAAFPKAKILGVTATPVRLDGQGLGRYFQKMVLGPTTQQLIDQKYLAPLRVFAPMQPDLTGVARRGGDYIARELETVMRPTITGSAVEQYEKHAAGQRAIVFCPSINHALATASSFRSRGHRAQTIDGTLDSAIRRSAIDAFRAGQVPILTSCDLVSEGFDLPAIEVAIALRPTQSLGLWLQQVGRALRPSPGKTHAILLDHAGNTLRHGLPTDPIEWSLKEGITARAGKKPLGIRVCTACFAVSAARATHCVECGAPFPIKPREVEHVAGELHEVTQIEKARALKQSDFETLDALIKLGQARGYKNPLFWAKHVMQGRIAKRKIA
jgi:DNA repair protein RadD